MEVREESCGVMVVVGEMSNVLDVQGRWLSQGKSAMIIIVESREENFRNCDRRLYHGDGVRHNRMMDEVVVT